MFPCYLLREAGGRRFESFTRPDINLVNCRDGLPLGSGFWDLIAPRSVHANICLTHCEKPRIGTNDFNGEVVHVPRGTNRLRIELLPKKVLLIVNHLRFVTAPADFPDDLLRGRA